MKSILLLLLFTGVAYSNTALGTRFKTNGFPAKVSVSVIDQDDRPVSNAQVKFVFTLYPSETTTDIQRMTDEKGFASAEANTNDGIVIHVQKEGYYKSAMEYKVWKTRDSYQTGRWEPWNPTIKIRLLKTRQPQKRVRIHLRFSNLEPSKEYGFDFLKGKLIDPSEDSSAFDVVFIPSGNIFSPDSTNTGDWELRSNFRFNNSYDGIIERERNSFSEMRFDYLAPTNGYLSTIEYSIQRTNYENSIQKPFPKNTEYLVLKLSRISESEEILTYYGIIESWNVGKTWRTGKAYFEIMYRINSESGDRNIEYYR